MYGLELVTPPAAEPVSTSELKAHLRLNTTDEDTLLGGYITAARDLFERLTDRQCVTATYRLYLDAFPRVIRLPRAPLASVTSVTYYDSNDTLQTWASANYSVDTKREPGRVVPSVWFPDWKIFAVYPPLSYKRSPKITVEFVAGYGNAAAVPQLIKQAITLMAANYFEQRTPVVTGTIATELPLGFKAIVGMYKLNWYGNMNPPQYHSANYGYACE